MDQKMNAFALWILLVPLWTNGDFACSRIGQVCKDCATLGYCDESLQYDHTKELKCPPNFVCDEWSVSCIRNGICRYKPTSCSAEAGLIPDPYSCRGFMDCATGDSYYCPPKHYYSNNTCKDATGEKTCEEYPALCLIEGSSIILDDCFIFECTKENNLLYPKYIGNDCSISKSS